MFSKFIRFLLFVLVVAVAVFVGAAFEPIKDQITNSIALMTNSRLPESSSLLAYSLRTPSNLKVSFANIGGTVELSWSPTSWTPTLSTDWEFQYEIWVIAPDSQKLGPFIVNQPSVSLPSVAAYVGADLRFTVQAFTAFRIDSFNYDFRSEHGETVWTALKATPTPTNTPTSIPTSTPTNTPTRLPIGDPQLSYYVSAPENVTFGYLANGDSGALSWGKSSWVPSKPPDSSSISYEVRIIYPNRTLGPYNVTGNRRAFSNLDTQPIQSLRFTIVAVGFDSHWVLQV